MANPNNTGKRKQMNLNLYFSVQCFNRIYCLANLFKAWFKISKLVYGIIFYKIKHIKSEIMETSK